MLRYFHKSINKFGAVVVLAVLFVMPYIVAAGSSLREDNWRQFMDKYQAYLSELHANTSSQKRRVIDAQWYHDTNRSFVFEAMELYRQNPRDRVAYNAMLFMLTNDVEHKLYETVCRNLRSYHLRNPKLNLALAMDFPLTVFSDECERLFNEAAVSGVNQQVRDTAKYQLANVYLEMAIFLANTSDLQMTPHAYLTSEVRASFRRLPEKTAQRISRQLHNRSWLKRKWQAVRFRALELAKELESSSRSIEYYFYTPEGAQQESGEIVGELVKPIRFQLEQTVPGASVSDFGAKDLKGRPASFDNYRGKVVVLDIWATWCKPCIEEFPYLRSLKKRMRGRPFEVITVSIDRDQNDVKSFIRRKSMPFTNWYIGEDVDFLSKWPVWPLPKLFVIDETGVIRSMPSVGHQDLTRYLDRLVTEAERSGHR